MVLSGTVHSVHMYGITLVAFVNRWSDTEMGSVKCADCGLLGVFNEETRTVDTIDGEYIKTGKHRTHVSVKFYQPACVESCRTFPECRTSNDIVSIINQEIICNHFLDRTVGRSPVEHQEMRILELVNEKIERSRVYAETVAERRHQENLAVSRNAMLVSVIVSALTLIVSTLVALYVAGK